MSCCGFFVPCAASVTRRTNAHAQETRGNFNATSPGTPEAGAHCAWFASCFGVANVAMLPCCTVTMQCQRKPSLEAPPLKSMAVPAVPAALGSGQPVQAAQPLPVHAKGETCCPRLDSTFHSALSELLASPAHHHPRCRHSLPQCLPLVAMQGACGQQAPAAHQPGPAPLGTAAPRPAPPPGTALPSSRHQPPPLPTMQAHCRAL